MQSREGGHRNALPRWALALRVLPTGEPQVDLADSSRSPTNRSEHVSSLIQFAALSIINLGGDRQAASKRTAITQDEDH